LVIWSVKIVPEMTYNVLSGTLASALLLPYIIVGTVIIASLYGGWEKLRSYFWHIA